MKYPRLSALVVTALALVASASFASATTIEREFRYAADRISLKQNGGVTDIQMMGAVDDFTPGRPALPWVGESIQLPAGTRLARVEVIGMETAPLASSVKLASTVVPKPGLGPIERSAPDPAYFDRAGFQPAQAVVQGLQGFRRGEDCATLKICPVRWDAKTGSLERVSSIRVRLTLESSAARPVARERIVPDWEEPGMALGTTGPSRTNGADAASGLPKKNEPFKATQVPSLLGSPVEYVIITSDALASEFQRLADWKTQAGVPAVVRTLSFIQQQYPRGSDDAERIRDFIKDAYSRWGTKWVLLGGDTDVLPTRLARTTYFGGENIACDMYYSCLDGNWDADGDKLYGEGSFGEVDPGDNVDLFPDVYVGRAPVSSLAQAQQFVNKTFQVERTPVGDYENSMLFFAEVLFPENWQTGQMPDLDGAALAEELLPYINANPNMRYARLYQNYTEPSYTPGSLQETRQAVIDSLSKGYGISVHIGHGYRNVMSVGDGNIYNSDVLAMTNGNRLTSLYAINCTSNAIDFPCIGEAILHANNGGAVTNVGSTRFDFPYAGRHFEKEYFRLVFQDSVTAVGEAQAKQKLPLVSFSDYDGSYRWMQFTLLLLGDPELRLWTRRPRTLTVTHAASVPASDTTFSVHVTISGTPLMNARVTAYKPNDEFRTALTNSTGDVVLPFRPDSAGNFTVTVTGYDCKPYQATVTLTTPAAPQLADRTPTIDDDAIGGTSGDNDQLWDAGETIDVRVPLRNTGGSSASSVVAGLSTTDPIISITAPSVSYGTIAAGAQVTSAGAFRIVAPFTAPDQREVPFKLTVTDAGGHSWVETLQLVLHAPELHHFAHQVNDAGGNNNGFPDPGEVVTYIPVLKNLGTGQATNVTAKLRSSDGLSVIPDSTSSWGTIAPGEEKNGDGLTFVPSNGLATLELHVFDQFGQLFVQTLDIGYPGPAADVEGLGTATTIQLSWTQSAESDLLGYNVYRSSAPGGPFARVNRVPTDRIATYEDGPLPSLTRFYYEVTVVDSSGNESSPSAVATASTNPPSHTIFPIPTAAQTFAPVAVDHVYPGYPLDIVAGGDVLYMWHPDGTAPVDADGAGSTSGDLTVRGSNFYGGASIADLDGDGEMEIIGVASDSTQVLVMDRFGVMKPGWPRVIADGVWSSVAIGDLNNDGKKELVFASTQSNGGSPGNKLYVLRYDGTEWMDGDNNPSTFGVFKVLGSAFNFGTPVIADLDGNGVKDIIYGSFDGHLYAWRPDGTNLPGFPITIPGGGLISGSAAVGYLDGPGDNQLDIVVATGSLTTHNGPDSLYAFTATGARRAGFPKFVRFSNNTKAPSPALADMNNDGFVDIVVASTNGKIYVYDRNGNIVGPWNGVTFSSMTTGATEASPTVADINGDGANDVVIGDEQGMLTALSNNGTVLAGFPIKVDAEIKGAAALCDCDGDGKTEIVVAGWDKNVYMWDYDFTFSPGGTPPWPQYHHDALRTGLMTNPPFQVGVEPPPPTGPVHALDFSSPWPNPSRAKTRLWYGIPADRAGSPFELAIYDLSGRKVQILEHGVAQSGRHSADWNLADRSGDRVEPGIYFVRLSLGSERLSHKLIVLDR